MISLGRRAVLATGVGVALVGNARAQTWPDRPVRMVVPAQPAGRPTWSPAFCSRISRPSSASLCRREQGGRDRQHRHGRGRSCGGRWLHHAACPLDQLADPALYGKTLGYEPSELVSIAYVASVPLIVVAPMDGPKTLAELIAALRKEPEKYSYASSGNGGLIHLAGYLFLERAGVKGMHVPYRGSAPGLIDTMAGRHAFQMDTLGSSKGFIDGGKMRVLAVAADKRLKQLSDVPTVEEVAGFKFAINTWYVAQAPAATPKPIVDKLNAAFNKALALPEVVRRMDELAIEPIQSTPESAKKFFDSQMAFWDPIVKASGAKAE